MPPLGSRAWSRHASSASRRRRCCNRPRARRSGRRPAWRSDAQRRMRFFEHQDDARRETLRLMGLFALAVLVTVGGVHLALTACWLLLRIVLPLPFPHLFLAVNVGVT